MKDLAPERRRQADRRRATDEKIDQYFVFFTGMLVGALIVIISESL